MIHFLQSKEAVHSCGGTRGPWRGTRGLHACGGIATPYKVEGFVAQQGALMDRTLIGKTYFKKKSLGVLTSAKKLISPHFVTYTCTYYSIYSQYGYKVIKQ